MSTGLHVGFLGVNSLRHRLPSLQTPEIHQKKGPLYRQKNVLRGVAGMWTRVQTEIPVFTPYVSLEKTLCISEAQLALLTWESQFPLPGQRGVNTRVEERSEHRAWHVAEGRCTSFDFSLPFSILRNSRQTHVHKARI